jgi:ATP-dependent protease ClpP protease subunit
LLRARTLKGFIMPNADLQAQDFRSPAVTLSGIVDYDMYRSFRQQLDQAGERTLVVCELSTLGGDPEVARMMGEDIRFNSELAPDRRYVFLGKAAIYSAGVTFMSFFVRENRYVTRGSRLMIHERKLSKTLTIDGPLTTCLATVQATLNEIECSIAIQNEGFQNLVRGSQVPIEDVLKKAPSNWYLEASEARELGLIEAIL